MLVNEMCAPFHPPQKKQPKISSFKSLQLPYSNIHRDLRQLPSAFQGEVFVSYWRDRMCKCHGAMNGTTSWGNLGGIFWGGVGSGCWITRFFGFEKKKRVIFNPVKLGEDDSKLTNLNDFQIGSKPPPARWRMNFQDWLALLLRQKMVTGDRYLVDKRVIALPEWLGAVKQNLESRLGVLNPRCALLSPLLHGYRAWKVSFIMAP